MPAETDGISLDRGRVEIRALTKRFGEVKAVNQVSATIEPGEFFALLGPSGCGKSTLLRLIAGLEEPDGEGDLRIGGLSMGGVAAQARPTAMVFQSYALFPSMTVGENVAYGLTVRRVPKPERTRRTAEALTRVGMEQFADRSVTALSGGQQQRVAVARALAVAPDVLLFDEPLSNLDVALRERTRTELRSLQQRLGITSIYVTHDQQEAMAVADRIAVMRDGQIVQTGEPERLYREPETAFVARFLGGANIIREPGLARLIANEDAPQGCVLAVRPEHLVPDPSGPVSMRLENRAFLGTVAEWTLTAKDSSVRAWVDPAIATGETVTMKATDFRWVQDDENAAEAGPL